MLKSVPVSRSWYQSSSYWPSSFALVASENDDGSPHLAPYQLVLPFDVSVRPSVMLTTRDGAKTLNNILSGRKCSMNFLEIDKTDLTSIVSMGYPRVSHEKRMEINPYKFIKHNNVYIIEESFQTYVCSFVEGINSEDSDIGSIHVLLGIDDILLDEKWIGNTEEMPTMPITFGYRGGNDFWFAETSNAHKLPVHVNSKNAE